MEQDHALSSANWEWNPRQTGDASEPDIRATQFGKTIISGEVTTSPNPIGKIDSRMASTLRKLAEMEGRKLYFVSTISMARRACTKAGKAGYNIEVVRIEDASHTIGERQDDIDATLPG